MTTRSRLIANIKRLRKKPVAEAAEKAGLKAVTWYKIESGERFPRPEQIDAIAKALGVKVAKLFE